MSKAKDLLMQMASVLKVDCDVSLRHQFDESIAELEAQEDKSCDGCKYSFIDRLYGLECLHPFFEKDCNDRTYNKSVPNDFFCKYYEIKEQ